jgi:hypothetical protein
MNAPMVYLDVDERLMRALFLSRHTELMRRLHNGKGWIAQRPPLSINNDPFTKLLADMMHLRVRSAPHAPQLFTHREKGVPDDQTHTHSLYEYPS